jgi:protein-disulfide isomerase
MSVAELLDSEARRRARSVTADDVAAFIEMNPVPVQAPDVLTPLVTALLQKRAFEQARQEFVEVLRSNPASRVQVRLEPPRVMVSTASHNPLRGREGAPVKLVLFSDFQCPFCQRAEPVIARLLERFSDDVELAWRHYPLSIHSQARLAAEAAQCAHDQNAFWQYHDALFADQSRLQKEDLIRTAGRVGLDADLFGTCLSSRAHARDVADDAEAGDRAGVNGTPTLFVNGVAFVGSLPYETYERAILAELARMSGR